MRPRFRTLLFLLFLVGVVMFVSASSETIVDLAQTCGEDRNQPCQATALPDYHGSFPPWNALDGTTSIYHGDQFSNVELDCGTWTVVAQGWIPSYDAPVEWGGQFINSGDLPPYTHVRYECQYTNGAGTTVFNRTTDTTGCSGGAPYTECHDSATQFGISAAGTPRFIIRDGSIHCVQDYNQVGGETDNPNLGQWGRTSIATCTTKPNTIGRTVLAYNGVPPASAWSASSLHGDCDDANYFGVGAILETNNDRCACLGGNNEYLQLDLGSPMTVTGIATQGRPWTEQWVKLYEIQISNDNSVFTRIHCATESGGYCPGNTGWPSTKKFELVSNDLVRPVTARYVRLYVKDYNSYGSIRMGVYVREGWQALRINLENPAYISHLRITPRQDCCQARMDMVQIRVGNDEHEISNNPRCNVGSTKILFFEDTSPYSWTEAWRLALARGGRLPTLTECKEYIAQNGGFPTENLWMPVTSPISPDESITRVQIEGTPNLGAEYCRIGHSWTGVWGQGHFADLNPTYDPINLLDAWGTGAHQKMLGVVRDEGIPWKDGDLTVKDIGCFATGKYVWIYTYTSFSQMNFAEVKIMGIEQPWKNLARSCTYGACPSDSNIGFPGAAQTSFPATDLQKTQNPSRAVDGLFSRHTAFYAGFIVDDPWWRVELQSRADVKMVRITGQMDFASGNDDVDIRVGDSPIPSKNPVCASGVTRSTLTQFTVHTDAGSHSWSEAKAFAESQGGRLPTLNELRHYEATTSYFATANFNHWIPVLNHMTPSGADYFMGYNGHGYSIGDSRWERDPSDGDPIGSTFGTQDWTGVGEYAVWVSTDSAVVPCVGEGNFVFVTKAGTATSFSLMQVEVLGTYQESCPVNHYGRTPVPYAAVVSVDDTTFDRGVGTNMHTHIDLGERTWNIQSNGGFTAVARFMFTGTPNDCTWCRIFDFGNGADNDNILLARAGDNQRFKFEFREGTQHGNDACVVEESGHAIHFNHWQTAVARYRAVDNTLELTISSDNHIDRIFHGSEDPITFRTTCTNGITDRTLTNNYIGKSNWADDYFHGKIAGVHAFDYYLTDAECETVLHSIVYGASRHTGAWMDYAGVGRDGSFGNIGPVVSVDDTWFDRTHPIDLGPTTWNLFAGGGFTIVSKFRFTNTVSSYETIFLVSKEMNDNNKIALLRYTTTTFYVFYSLNGNWCTRTDLPVSQNEWNTLIFRYQASSNELTALFNGVMYKQTCTALSAISYPYQNLEYTYTFLGKNTFNDPVNHFDGDIAGLYAFDRYMSLPEAQEVLDGIEVNTTFLDARDCTYTWNTVADFTDKNTEDDWNNYATSIGGTSTLTHYSSDWDALWIGGSGASATGYFELPLPAEYNTFHITWGSSSWTHSWGTVIPVTLCLCSSAGNLCSSAACTVLDSTSGQNDAKITVASYTSGQILHIEENFDSIDANIVIKLSSCPNRLFPGNDFLGTQFLETKAINMSDGLVSRFKLEEDLTDTECADPCIDWSVEWKEDTIAPWGHDAWLSWATSQTASPWTGSGPAPQSRPLFAHELIHYLSSHKNINFPVGGDEWAPVRNNEDEHTGVSHHYSFENDFLDARGSNHMGASGTHTFNSNAKEGQYSIQLSGGQYLESSNNINTADVNDFSFWLWLDRITGRHIAFAIGSDFFFMIIDDTQVYISNSNSGCETYKIVSFTWSKDRWYHVRVVIESKTQWYCFIDGQTIISGSLLGCGTSSLPSGKLFIGRIPGNTWHNAESLQGMVDDFTISPRATYTWVQVASASSVGPYKYLHTTEYQDSSGYSETSASWDGYMFRMVPSIREITTNELELARMCGANSDQPCNVIGRTDYASHEFSCIVSTCAGSGWHSTTADLNQWLRIDLGQASRVNRIVVHPPNHGGGNYYAGRVDGIQIHIGDVDTANGALYTTTENPICGMIQVPLDGTQNTNPGPFALDCNLKGQYVYMRWLENDGDWKQAGSVYVYGHRLPTFHYDNIRGQVLDNSAQQHYIRSAELSSVLDQDSFTVSVWVKTDDFSASNHIVNRYDLNEENGERGGMAWYILTDKRVLCQRSYTGGNSWVNLYSNTLLVERQWYHLTYVSSPKELRLYINGVFDNSDTAPTDWAFTQQYTTNKIGLGLYCTAREFTPVFHYDDIDVTGTQALNAGQSTWNFARNQGFGVVIKMKWTAVVSYQGFFAFQSTSNSHKIELIRFSGNSALYLHWYDANGVACNSPNAAGPGGTTHGIPTPSNTWFTMKILYDHSSKQLCQWVNGDEKCHTCPSNFGALTDTVMDSWLGATSQTNSFSGAIGGIYAFDHTLNSYEHNDVENSIQIDTSDLPIDLGCYEHSSGINRGHRQDLRFYNTALSAEAIGRVASYPGNNATIVTHTTLPSRDIRNLVVSVDDTNFIPRFFSVGSGTFSQVQASCLSAGGKLASIHNAEEQREAYDICLQVVGGGYGCYIGITADGTGQPWYWVDGSTIEYTNWGGTEGGSGGNAGGETVAIFMSYSPWVGEWGDWGTGADSFPGICKRNDDSLLPHPVSFLDFGPKQFNLVSDGGFTAVMKVKWTGTAGSYEKVFDFATGIGGENLDGEILLARYGTDRRVYFRIFEGSTNMGTAFSDYIIMQDQWYNVMCRYTATSNLMELKIDGYHYTTTPPVGIKDRIASSSWIGRSHWGNAYFTGEIAGLYAFSASLTDREVDRILAGIHINATDDFETSHHNDIVLHDTHQTCSACPGDMYAPAGSTGMSQCQHQCPAGTYAESVRLYPSDRNVDPSWPEDNPSNPISEHWAEMLGDFSFSDFTVWPGAANSELLHCVQVDLGQVYPVSKVHVWQYYADGRTYRPQNIKLSKTGLWTTTEQTGDEVIAWSCSISNCPAEPSNGAGRVVNFEPIDARFVRHCSARNSANIDIHWMELHVYGTLCTSCPAGSHSPRGSTSHSDCLCESQHPRDYGNYTDKYMEERTGVNGWTLAKYLAKDGTRWFSRDHMLSSRWVVGALGATCDDTCGVLNLKCDSPAQTAITSPELMDAAMQDTGFTCAWTSSSEGLGYAGSPFHKDNDICFFFDPTKTSTGHTAYSTSQCSSNSHSNHRPLCHCVGFSDYEQTTQTYHPDWTEILFVRAPKTSNEKWVRMSRSQWDAIASEDYDGGVVDADVLDAYPFKTTTTKVKRRNDGDTSPWVFAPPSTGTSPVDEFTAVYASYDSASHTTNTAWDHQKPVGTEFQVFVRAPTWRDHYVGCLDTSGGDPPGYNLGQISSVNTFVDALLICSNYEYFTISCGHRVDCLHTFNDNLLVTDNACRGQPELTPGINSGTDSFCVPPTYPNIGSDGASMGGYAKNAVYSTKSRTHTCQAKDLNCGMGEAVHSEVTLNLEPNDGDDTPGVRGTSYFYVRNGECGGSEISMLDQFSASTKEEQEQACADVCLAYTGWKASGFILHTALNTCYCEYEDSSGSGCAPQWGDGWHRYDFYPTHAEISNMAYLAGGRLPTPYELRTWLLDGHMLAGIIPTSHTEADPHSIAAVYNPERLNGEDWMWLNGRFATQLYSDHQVVMPTTPQSPYPDTHWIGTEIPVVLSGVSLTNWHCWTGSSHIKPLWTQNCVNSCPYPTVDAVLTMTANWCQTPQNLLSNTEARMANCGGGSYDWGANHYCPVWNPDGSPTNPGADAVHVILDAGSPVEVKAFKWAASGNSNRLHGSMRVYRSDDAVTWTTINTFDVSASSGGPLDDTNPDATVEDMVGVFGNYDFGTARYWKFSPYGAQYQVNGLLLRICSTATCKPARQLVTAFDTPTCSHCPASNAKGGAVVSMDDRSFDAVNNEYVNLGSRTWNIETSGFTAVTKVRFATLRTGETACPMVFHFGNGPGNDNMYLCRGDQSTQFLFSLREGGSSCFVLSGTGSLIDNSWHTVVARYNADTGRLSLNVDGAISTKVCTNGLRNRVTSNNYIGKSNWDSDPYLNADIAGLYVYASYMNDIEIASVTQGIHINQKDDLHPDTCMENCPSGTYRNTTFHGAVISQDDTTFVRSAEYFIDVGIRTWKIASNGGFTAITRLRAHAILSWEGVWDIGNGFENDNIYLARDSTNLYFQVAVRNGNTAICDLDSAANTYNANTWHTVVLRYSSSTLLLEIDVDGIRSSSICDHSGSNTAITDRTTLQNTIGIAYWNTAGTDSFDGEIAGHYAWDRYLSDAEVTKVVDSIHISATDDSLENTCACAADTYARKEETIHFHSIDSLTVSWDDAVDYATRKGGRLPTKDEMIVYTSKLNNLPDWSDPSVYICDEDGGHDCLCHGWVRYGAGTQWTPDTFVYDKIYCGSDSFAGGDPAYGAVKDCWCYPKFLGWVPISDPHMPDGRNWMYLDDQHYKTFYQWQQHIWPTMLIADTDSTTLYNGGGSFCTSDNNCARCQGDCDNDGECLGHLVCFERDGFTAVPGCDAGGSGDADGYDYCVDPNYLPALHDVAANNDIELKPLEPTDLVCSDGTYKCGECEGDCDSDTGCKAGLKCYQRTHNLDVVPGCETTGFATNRDYCYDPNIPVLGDHNVATYNGGGSFCTSSNPCSKCQGDCDSSSDCQGGLLCWQRGGGSDLFYMPGCQHLNIAETTGYDFCYDPKDMLVPERLTVSSLVWVNTEENCHACQHGAGAPVGSVEGDCACKSPTYQSKSTVDPDVEAIVGSTGWNLIKELPAYGTTWYTNDELNIRKQTVGAGKIYDFTGVNSKDSWKAYASKIGATTSIQSWDATAGVWAGSSWIGWLELPLPDNFDTVEIDWGHGYSSGVVKLCICNTLGQVNSGLANEGYGYLTTYTSRCDNNNALDECSVVQEPATNEDLKYGPIRYQKGQVVRIEEVFSTLNADIVIKLTNSQGYDDVPTPHFISNVVVDGCRRPNTGTQCRQAVPDGYTFEGSGAYSTDGCYCYESGTYAGECYYGNSWAYRNTLPALTLPKFRPCLPETSFECIPYSFQACENAIPEGFTLSTISSANQDGCYCYTRDSASGNNANWCYYGTGGQDWVDPGVVSETATQFRPYGYDCGNQPESFTYVPDDEEWDEILFTREPHIDTYECEVSTTVSSSRPGFEGQPCVFPTIDGSTTYNSCADTISGTYPYGWCSLDPSGSYSSADGSKWGHCKPEKDICYTCTVTNNGNQRHHVEGSPCKFPWTLNGDAAQNPYGCREIGSGTYPLGWCTPDDVGVGHAEYNYDSSSVSTWGKCVTGKCLARTTNNGMDWIHVTKASFDANLAHNYSPQWLGVPVLDWSGRGATDMTGLSNYIEHTGIHALSSPWLTLAPYTGVSVMMDHMIYHEEGDYYNPVGHDWSSGDKPMGTRFRTFVRNSKTSLDPPVITLNPVNNYRTFASTSDVLDMGSENRFNIKTNGGLTIVMKFRIHSGIATGGQWPSIFSFKEGAGTGRQNNFYLNIATTMYFTLVKEDINDVYGTTACGMSSLQRPPENEFVDMVLVYDKNAQFFSISFSHINGGSAQTSACSVDLGDRMGRFHFNDNLLGSNEGTGFLGDIAGFFAYDRVLSNEAINVLKSSIHTDKQNDPIPQTIVTDDPFVCLNTGVVAPETGTDTEPVTTIDSCPAGQELISNTCHQCPIGKYKDNVGSSACLDCAVNKNTASTGAGNSNLCQCIPGYFNSNPDDACLACGTGKYRAGLGSAVACDDCPAGSTTVAVGQDEEDDCQCSPGYGGVYCSSDTTCTAHFGNDDAVCVTDPESFSTSCEIEILWTLAKIDEVGDDCDSVCGSWATGGVCDPAHFSEWDSATELQFWIRGLAEDWSLTMPDNINRYNPGEVCDCMDQYSLWNCQQCTLCDDSSSYYQNECKVWTGHSSGMLGWHTQDQVWYYGTSLLTCDSSNWRMRRLCPCKVTPFIGIISGESCGPCPTNYYKANTGGESCTACPVGATSAAGSTSISDCTCTKPNYKDGPGDTCVCEAGYGGTNVCDLCGVGFTKTAENTEECTACGSFETSTGGSSPCVCIAGYYKPDALSACQACDIGSYKDAVGTQACDLCGDGTNAYTDDTGSTNITDCHANTGYYSTNGVISACFADSTSAAGSTSDLDCVCNTGFTFDAGSCSECEAGKYKNTVGSSACLECDNAGNGWGPVGLADPSQCVCNAGYYSLDDVIPGLVLHYDDISLTGTQTTNVDQSDWDFAQNEGFSVILKLKWTASRSHEGFLEIKWAYGSEPRITLLRDDTDPADWTRIYLEYRGSNGVSCDSPNSQDGPGGIGRGIPTPSNTWFTLKLIYDDSSKQICQWIDGDEKCHTCPSNFAFPDATFQTFLGGTHDPAHYADAFSGSIAGIFAFDRTLNSEEHNEVGNKINVASADSAVVETSPQCIACEAGKFKGPCVEQPIEVNLARYCGETKDQACPVSASSYHSFAPPSLATNGIYEDNSNSPNYDTLPGGWRSSAGVDTHTQIYLKIDFGQAYTVDYIKVYPWQGSLSHYKIDNTEYRVGDIDEYRSNNVCHYFGELYPENSVKTLNCGATGRYLFVTKPFAGSSEIWLAEVEAYGTITTECEWELQPCTDCPDFSSSTTTTNVDVSSCKCNAGAFGTGGACTLCTPGTYTSTIDSPTCTDCPDNSQSSLQGSDSITSCLCNVGYEKHVSGDGTCSACAAGKYAVVSEEDWVFATQDQQGESCDTVCADWHSEGICDEDRWNEMDSAEEVSALIRGYPHPVTFAPQFPSYPFKYLPDGVNCHKPYASECNVFEHTGSGFPSFIQGTSWKFGTNNLNCAADYTYSRRLCPCKRTSPHQCEGVCPNNSTSPEASTISSACECLAGYGLQNIPDATAVGPDGGIGQDGLSYSYVKVGDFHCDDQEIQMYDGYTPYTGYSTYADLDYEGRLQACADACLTRKTPLTGTWDNFILRGFSYVVHGNIADYIGACWCESGDSATCTQIAGGYTVSNGRHRYDFKNNQECRLCPSNSYKGVVGNAACESCPSNSQAPEGSYVVADCQCNKGYYGPDGGPCTACHYGKYKDYVGPDTRLGYSACEPCASDRTINFVTAATSYRQCSCNPGTFMLTPENAHLAYYYDASDAGTGTCEPCPSGSSVPEQWQFTGIFGDGGYVTTYSQSGTWPTSCTNCGPNSQTTGIASQCECDAGFVKNSASECEALPGGYFTQSVGETVKVEMTVQVSMTLSQFDSNARYQYREGVAEAAEVRIEAVTIVQVTEMGAVRRRLLYSQLNIETAIEVPAQITTDTVTTNNVIESAEFIESQLSVSNVVQSLESKPAFQSASVQVTSSASISGSCPENSVAPSGATSRSQCVCNAGYTGVISEEFGSCTACESGKYKETVISCGDCPGNSDSPAASDAITQCSCNAGYHGSNGGSCTACSQDTFKPTNGDQSCTDCTPFSSTNGLDTQTSTSACICDTGYLKQADETCDRICAAGYEASSDEQTCVQCLAGKFKDSIGDGSCQLCPDFSVMTIAGATSVDDCLCQQGYVKTAENFCTACTPGKFTSQAGEPECHTCYTLLTGR